MRFIPILLTLAFTISTGAVAPTVESAPTCVPGEPEIVCTGDGRDLNDDYAACPGRYVDVFVDTPVAWQYAQACVEERGRGIVYVAGVTGYHAVTLP